MQRRDRLRSSRIPRFDGRSIELSSASERHADEEDVFRRRVCRMCVFERGKPAAVRLRSRVDVIVRSKRRMEFALAAIALAVPFSVR